MLAAIGESDESVAEVLDMIKVNNTSCWMKKAAYGL